MSATGVPKYRIVGSIVLCMREPYRDAADRAIRFLRSNSVARRPNARSLVALGISFAFIKDLIGSGLIIHPGLLFAAWLSWGLSIVSTLASFFFSELCGRHSFLSLVSFPGSARTKSFIVLRASPRGFFVAAANLVDCEKQLAGVKERRPRDSFGRLSFCGQYSTRARIRTLICRAPRRIDIVHVRHYHHDNNELVDVFVLHYKLQGV